MSRYVEKNLSRLLENLGERRNGKVSLPHGLNQMPFEMPSYIEVGRVLGPTSDGAEELLGHIMTLYAYTVGHVIEVKHFRRPSGIAIYVDGERVFYDRPKTKPAKARNGLKKVAKRRMSRDPDPVPDHEVFDDDEIE